MKMLIGMICTLMTLNLYAHTETQEKSKLNFFPSELGFAEQVPTGFLKVVGGNLSGFPKSGVERQKVLDSFSIIEAVINSNEFKERVINFKSSDGKRSYSSNRGMSNEQVYEYLMRGQELVGGENNLGEMNFDVRRYYRGWSKVIGYTSPGKSNTISVNGRFYSRYSITQISSNLVHEWIHLNGFLHDSAKDHDSVPYAIGYIAEELAEKYLSQGHLD
jgi:hypothetical protein